MQPTHLHFDGYSGLSGDMTLGALVDLGVPLDRLEAGLRGLPIGPFRLRAEKVMRAGLTGTQVHVDVEEEHHVHRHLRHINEIVDAAGLPPRVLERAKAAYRRLAEAEARVHGSTPEKIHFHEVGAKDAIVDVAGAMLGIELLGVETFSAGALTTGYGTVVCMHGRMPVPAPATAELLRGMPQVPGEREGEMITPTGAAILGTLLDGPGGRGFIVGGQGAALRCERIGYGAGTRTYEGFANYLRLMLCQPLDGGGELPVRRESVQLLECEVDDMTPEWAGALMDRLLAEGALDVQFQSVQMKKNRPGLGIRVLAAPAREAHLAELILRETSTFGLRRSAVERWALERRAETLPTELGDVAVKVGLWGEGVLKITPEFEACRVLAERHGLALTEVYARVQVAIRERMTKDGASA